MNKKNLSSAILAFVALLLVGLLVQRMWPRANDSMISEHQATEPAFTAIRLSNAKRTAAEIKTTKASRQSMTITRTLPGRFVYDDTKHVALRAPTDGVIESVSVKPGDEVLAGQSIAVLRSPSIGTARSEILAAQAALELATTERDWQVAIFEGVKNLAASVRAGEPLEEIEKQYGTATLGKYRSQILTNYSKALLAHRLSTSVNNVATGAISGRVVQSRQSEQQQTQAELDSVIEQSLFETKQAYKKSEAEADAAKRKLFVARQTLSTLLGANSAVQAVVSPGDPDLARLEVTSPINGTVERKVYSATERVTVGGEMFVIADTSSLWVEGDIRGRDWDVIQVSEGDTVFVTTPAAGDQRLVATVYFLGREVDAASGAIPLVAQITNEDHRFRPGLFARMEVPVQQIDDVLVVPESAVVNVEGEATVFVAEGKSFHPVTVQTGVRSNGKIEIRSGINEGQSVVTNGAFILKSELLLEGEE